MKNIYMALLAVFVMTTANAETSKLNLKDVKHRAQDVSAGFLSAGAITIGAGVVSITGEIVSQNSGGANIGLGLVIFSGAGVAVSGGVGFGATELVALLFNNKKLSEVIKSEYKVFKSALRVNAQHSELNSDLLVNEGVKILKCSTCKTTQEKVVVLNDLVSYGSEFIDTFNFAAVISNADVERYFFQKFGQQFTQANFDLILDIIALEFNSSAH